MDSKNVDYDNVYLGTWVPGYLGTWVPGYLGTWVPVDYQSNSVVVHIFIVHIVVSPKIDKKKNDDENSVSTCLLCYYYFFCCQIALFTLLGGVH